MKHSQKFPRFYFFSQLCAALWTALGLATLGSMALGSDGWAINLVLGAGFVLTDLYLVQKA